MEKIIAEFQKSKIELLRVGLNEFRGHQLATIRVWTTRPDGDPLPTKKGVTIQASMLPDLVEALQKTEAAARKAGLLDNAPGGVAAAGEDGGANPTVPRKL